MVLGDSNVHVDVERDPLGRDCMILLESLGFTQHVTGPTHIHGHTLDSCLSWPKHSELDHHWSYGFRSLCFYFWSINPGSVKLPARCIETRSLNSSTTDKFLEALSASSFIRSGSAEKLVENSNDLLTNTLDTITPYKIKKVGIKRFSPCFNNTTCMNKHTSQTRT